MKVIKTMLLSALLFTMGYFSSYAEEQTETLQMNQPNYSIVHATVVAVEKEYLLVEIGHSQVQVGYHPESIFDLNKAERIPNYSFQKGDMISYLINEGPTPAVGRQVYQAEVIMVGDWNHPEANALKVAFFDQDFVSDENHIKGLILNVGSDTKVYDNVNHQMADIDQAKNNYLAVLYQVTTMSLPPQTNPNLVIILPDLVMDRVTEKTDVVDQQTEYVLKDFAQKAGYPLTWNADTQQVVLQIGDHQAIFTIGQNKWQLDDQAMQAIQPVYINNSNRTVIDASIMEVLKELSSKK